MVINGNGQEFKESLVSAYWDSFFCLSQSTAQLLEFVKGYIDEDIDLDIDTQHEAIRAASNTLAIDFESFEKVVVMLATVLTGEEPEAQEVAINPWDKQSVSQFLKGYNEYMAILKKEYGYECQ